MGTTDRGYPYPELPGLLTADIPANIQALAEAVDADITGRVVYVVKSGDETVTSSTTLQNDDGLFASVLSGATYEVSGMLFLTVGAGGVKVGWSAPSFSSMQWTASSVGAAAIGSAVNPSSPGGAGVWLRGRLIPGASGLLRFQWAQQTSDAAATTVLSGSYMRLDRIT